MPHYILRIKTVKGPRYIDWSTIVDAPVSGALTRAEIKEHWKSRYGSTSADIATRLKDADRYGTDCLDHSPIARVIAGNRAGPRESELTLAQIIDLAVSDEALNS